MDKVSFNLTDPVSASVGWVLDVALGPDGGNVHIFDHPSADGGIVRNPPGVARPADEVL